MKKQHKFYVTHIIVPELPVDGYDQVFYYSATAESYNLGKYYWGKGNNSFDQEYINDLLNQKKIFRLISDSYPMELNDDETLWVDKYGDLFIADINDPNTNQRKLKKQEPVAVEYVEKIYIESLDGIILPEVSKETFIVVP